MRRFDSDPRLQASGQSPLKRPASSPGHGFRFSPENCGTIPFHLAVFAFAFLIVCARRPDAVLNAQFWGEDGTQWYPDAYQYGLRSFTIPVAGYLHALIRSIALFSLLFPFSLAPLVMNLGAIIVQILPVNVILSSRFAHIGLRTRFLASLVYLALPNSFEIDANLTNVQWHLALLACLVLLAQPGNKAWRIFDGIIVGLTSISSPMGILLVPIAAALWWKRREKSSAILAILCIGAVIQIATLSINWQARQYVHTSVTGEAIPIGGPNGARFSQLVAILGRQVFFSSIFGLKTQAWLLERHDVFLYEAVATAVGLAFLLYALRYAALELKLFILFAFEVLAAGLIRPAAGPPNRPQWVWLCIPGVGNRYYFLLMLAFLASLLWLAFGKASTGGLRWVAVALLLLLPVGIYQDWRYPPFKDYHFKEYAAEFERAPSGTKVAIPINPGWLMQLTKH